ncbi:uncharacterized protein [Nicotiana tomentosiformis]|uniref:uncharacterized protein n=1 Tax=Nicotiana tomentosiformis TaxID=4098 RepID=UPI00051C1D54|nr:uncharacterized protein LOC104119922 [Nicotiana tomentosiformis]
MVTFVYAHNLKDERKALWEYVNQMSMGCQIQWIIMGNFNAVLQQENRLRGNPIALSEVVEFQECIDKCILMELPNNGYVYSWSDKQGINRICSKIDWVIVNGEWIDTMEQCKTYALSEGVSDHCPLVVEMIKTHARKGKAFRYCNMWSKYHDFMHMVEQGWAIQVEGCKMYQVVKNWKALKQKLRTLHKRNFSNVINEANKDREEM